MGPKQPFCTQCPHEREEVCRRNCTQVLSMVVPYQVVSNVEVKYCDLALFDELHVKTLKGCRAFMVLPSFALLACQKGTKGCCNKCK